MGSLFSYIATCSPSVSGTLVKYETHCLIYQTLTNCNTLNSDIQIKWFRELATMTYRSGPEWGQRFGRKRIDPKAPNTLCPTFEIESYLEHQGESFSTKYDPNSLLYISKVRPPTRCVRRLRLRVTWNIRGRASAPNTTPILYCTSPR